MTRDPAAELAALIHPPQPPVARKSSTDDYWAARDRRAMDALDALGEPDGPESASDLDSYRAGLRAEDSDNYWREAASA